MADVALKESALWEESIRRIETTDSVIGGEGGVPNIAPGQLANRTQYLKKEQEKHEEAKDPHPQYVDANELQVALENLNSLSLSSMVGWVLPFHMEGSLDGWLDLKGGEYSRTTDAKLWAYAQATGLLISQSKKDADPITYAMYFGDGDGETTFTLPNHHLGHFVRGTPSGIAHGTTQGDAIRNIYGTFAASVNDYNSAWTNGVFTNYATGTGDLGGTAASDKVRVYTFNASNIVPTAPENRPMTANISYKIHRGWK